MLKGLLWRGEWAGVAWFFPDWLFTLDMHAPYLDPWRMRLDRLGQ